MLLAIDTGSRRWWVIYGVATCLAMYTHYTRAFVLWAQFVWLVWAHPPARRTALLVNAAAAASFLPVGSQPDRRQPLADDPGILARSRGTASPPSARGRGLGLRHAVRRSLTGARLARAASRASSACAWPPSLPSRRRPTGELLRDPAGASADERYAAGVARRSALAVATPLCEGVIVLAGRHRPVRRPQPAHLIGGAGAGGRRPPLLRRPAGGPRRRDRALRRRSASASGALGSETQ